LSITKPFEVIGADVTNNRQTRGCLSLLHASAMPDNRYDGHTLRNVEKLSGCPIKRAYVDKAAQNTSPIEEAKSNLICPFFGGKLGLGYVRGQTWRGY
jgi:hypothetical protein